MKSQVIIPGAVKAGRNAKGFNLNKFVKKLLESMGFAVTTDCCTYYPTLPQLTNVVDYSSPTNNESDNVPPFGMFITVEPNSDDPIVNAWMKAPDGSNHSIWNNN